jgi:thioredoxin-related protein
MLKTVAPLVVFAALTLVFAGARAADTPDPASGFFDANFGDLQADLADARKAGKKAILLVFEQEGCPGCLYMHRNVLNRPDVQQFYHQHFYNYAIDIHGAVPLRDFAGRDSTEQGYSRLAGIKGTPTFAFYDLEGTEVVRMLGVIKEPAEFLLLGEFVASGTYKNRRFADFRRKGTLAAGER